MQLKSLWIKNYKNLKDLSLDFEKGNNLSILIGNNGSGKSNVLEAISGIFAEAYRNVSDLLESDYVLEYKIQEYNITLKKQSGKRKILCNNTLISKGTELQYLPSNVIALYSGEDLRLWENFYWQRYSEYLMSIYRKGYMGKMGMYYVNKYLWNIAFFVILLFLNDSEDLQTFIEKEIGISNFDKIKVKIDFDFSSYDKNRNQLLKSFIDKINQNKEITLIHSISEWRDIISDSKLFFSAQSNSVFDFLMLAFMPKNFKIISSIYIFLDEINIVQSLSEGEKKLILVKAVLEFIADENALLLLDEPDANIHEARKSKLYKLLKDTPNRDIVMTTHSPLIAKVADERELVYLESKDGIVSEIPLDKLNLVRKLAANEWNIMEACVFLNSEKPLVLFEGKSDIDFIKRAIELLKEDDPKYEKIDADFLCFNGTSNAARFITDLQLLIPTRKLIVLCDNDSAGKDAIGKIKKLKSEYIKCSLYPIIEKTTEKQFLLEDYFSEERIKKIINSIINIRHPYKDLPKLGECIKKELAANYLTYPKEDFKGFKTLLDKLLELLEID